MSHTHIITGLKPFSSDLVPLRMRAAQLAPGIIVNLVARKPLLPYLTRLRVARTQYFACVPLL
jgi:hypothetical protein